MTRAKLTAERAVYDFEARDSVPDTWRVSSPQIVGVISSYFLDYMASTSDPTMKRTTTLNMSFIVVMAMLLSGCLSADTSSRPNDAALTTWSDPSRCDVELSGDDTDVEPTDLRIVAVDELKAVALLTLRHELNGLSYEIATIVLRTADGGHHWSDVACLSGAISLVKVVPYTSLRLITQLRVAGNYPALWASDDAGSTWHERPLMDEIREDLTSTGVASVVEVEAMHFEDLDRGTLILDVDGQAQSVRAQTIDAGKTWEVDFVDRAPHLPTRAPGDDFHVVEDEQRFEVYRQDPATKEPVLIIPRAGW